MSDMAFDQDRVHSLKARQSSQEDSPTKQAHPSVGMLLHMQRTAGNAAVNALLSGRPAHGMSVQRTAAVDEGEKDTNIGERIRAAAGRGTPLGGDVQRTLESGLGASMANVNVHTDSEADHLARSVDSVAFTTGSDIFFRSGAYNPGTSEGMHLLAHEATHTVQQAQGPVSGTPTAGGVSVSDPSDSYERAAEASAANVMSGAGASAQRMVAGSADSAVQRVPVEEDEQMQTMRSSQYQAVQREAEGAEDEDEQMQTMRSSQFATVQREAGESNEEESESLQAMRSSQYEAVQRAAPEEEEQMQTMRASQFQAVQRAAPEEEDQVQAMRPAQFAAVQRHAAEEEA
jgi:uncharacterized protein DUF4157